MDNFNAIEEYKKVQSEINLLRDKLKDINQKKEHWFQKKESLKKDINEHITKIKELRSQKDQKKQELDQLKGERDKYNSLVKELISKIKNINEDKINAFKKYNVKIDPSKIQEKINNLEKKVEIETNFEREKKLKKVYGETSELFKIAEEVSNLSKQIKEARKKANEFHKKVLDSANDATYGVFMEFSQKITETKSLQEQAFQNFIDYKNQYSQSAEELKKKLETHDMLSNVLSKNNQLRKLQEMEKTKKIINDKSMKVEEKLKNKKRLTTDDILALQGKDLIEG